MMTVIVTLFQAPLYLRA